MKINIFNRQEKTRSLTKYRGVECLNCKHPLDISDRYCAYCGQLNSTKQLSFKDFLNEFLSGFFAYDSRIRKSLSTILFRPGKISKDYIQGKRTQYVNPFRFYLSISIIYFILFSFSNNYNDLDGFDETDTSTKLESLSESEIEQVNQELVSIPGINTIKLDSLANIEEKKTSYHDIYFSAKALDSMPYWDGNLKRIKLYNQFHKETEIYNSKRALEQLKHPSTKMNLWMYKKTVDGNNFLKNPGLFINYILGKMPLIIFFYLPFFTLFLWLLYFRKPFSYMEHLVFTFHIQSVFFIFLVISLLINLIIVDIISPIIIFLIFLFYLYKAMRNFYEQGRSKTIVKFVIINGLFIILAGIAIIISLFASFAIF
ncbi:DUF3667 domain-containing protein [Gillisia sp. M10.2A]|uniref:DUF3667 domain-containing protein n=1 Tax=Gillisia lutea TaxID=2909668 RepID=A0ABS9EHQ8_9FLAO|nr:DUF3667 domain-containing protein [Gillisia lutea]MCF4102381.1 DUF3667 domain-containing protein [Gillisia lutea]